MEPIDDRFRLIGVWTPPDTRAWAVQAYRRIYEQELRARLPRVRFCFHTAGAGDGPFLTEHGDIVTALDASGHDHQGIADVLVVAAADPASLGSLASALAGMEYPPPIVLSAVSAHGDVPGSCGHVVASALAVSVRDTSTLEAVRALATSERIPLIPDPLLLLSRLTAQDEARARIGYLRTMDGYPSGETVLVEVSEVSADGLATLGRSVADAISSGYRFSLVAIPKDGEVMSARLRHRVERTFAPVYCVEQPPLLEDLLAMVATSNAVVPLTPALFAVACALGRSSFWSADALWDRTSIAATMPGVERLVHENLARLLESVPAPSIADGWRAQVDAHFDAIAVPLSSSNRGTSHPATTVSSGMEQLETAHRVGGRRLADERLRFAERAEGFQAEIAGLEQELARRSALEAMLRQEAADAHAHARHEAARSEAGIRRHVQLEAEVSALRTASAALRDEFARISDVLAGVRQESCVRAETITAMTAENARQAEVIDTQHREIDELRGAVQRFARSRSWRYLAPARAVGRVVRRLLGIPT